VGFEEASLPAVVLQLPDLKASGQARSGGRFRYSSHLYWVALVLGALIALWLIMASGEAPLEPPTGEAPPWANSSTAAAQDTAPHWSDSLDRADAPPATWPASAAPTPANERAAAPALPAAAPQVPSHSPADAPNWTDPTAPSWPAADNWPRPPAGAVMPAPAVPELRTARSVDTHWDGSPHAIQPGTATPLGIGTPEPK
jgi:hypothetical protein